MVDEIKRKELLELTTGIVSSYVSHNRLEPSQIPEMIDNIFSALSNVHAEQDSAQNRPSPFVPIDQSVTPDYIICLEDGKELKMLKRYLKTAYDMSPEEYRARWGLPPDYPMVAPDYAKKRSQLAKDSGLGMARPVKHS